MTSSPNFSSHLDFPQIIRSIRSRKLTSLIIPQARFILKFANPTMNLASISAFYILVSVTLAVATSVTKSAEAPTAYDLLQSYNFPAGLLPQGITHYDLNPSTGEFHAYLNNTCSFSLEDSYQLSYKSTIGGRLEKNKLKDLKGVSVKVFFVWLNIVEVVRDGDDIELSVGVASANFPAGNFEECPQCGCGMDCGGKKKVEVERIRLRLKSQGLDESG